MIYLIILIAVILVLLAASKLSYFRDYFTDRNSIQLNWIGEVCIVLLIIGIGYFAVDLGQKKVEEHGTFVIGSLGEQEIAEINFLDRPVAGRWDIEAKSNGKIFKNIAMFLIPLLVILLRGSIINRLKLFFIFAQGYALSETITGLAKGLVDRYRPFAYRSLQAVEELSDRAKGKFMEDIYEADIKNSFFSGDASITAYSIIFFAIAFYSLYQDSKWKLPVWIMALIAVVLGCYFRTMSGKHFPTDVIIGGIEGALVAIVIWKIHAIKIINN